MPAQKGIRFDDDLLKQVEERAKREGRSFAGMVKWMCHYYILNVVIPEQTATSGKEG